MTLVNYPPRLPTRPTSPRPYQPLQSLPPSSDLPKPAAKPSARLGHTAPPNALHPPRPLPSSTAIFPTSLTTMLLSVMGLPSTAPSEHPASVVPSRACLTIPRGRARLVSPRQFRQCSTRVMDTAASPCPASTTFGNLALSTHWACSQLLPLPRPRTNLNNPIGVSVPTRRCSMYSRKTPQAAIQPTSAISTAKIETRAIVVSVRLQSQKMPSTYPLHRSAEPPATLPMQPQGLGTLPAVSHRLNPGMCLILKCRPGVNCPKISSSVVMPPALLPQLRT